jgi:hypothetical protein
MEDAFYVSTEFGDEAFRGGRRTLSPRRSCSRVLEQPTSRHRTPIGKRALKGWRCRR